MHARTHARTHANKHVARGEDSRDSGRQRAAPLFCVTLISARAPAQGPWWKEGLCGTVKRTERSGSFCRMLPRDCAAAMRWQCERSGVPLC
eukprot:2669414-Prymnesium_polylepis.2